MFLSEVCVLHVAPAPPGALVALQCTVRICVGSREGVGVGVGVGWVGEWFFLMQPKRACKMKGEI